MTDLSEAGRRLRDQPVAAPSDLGALTRRAHRIRRRRRLLVALPALAAIVVAAGVIANVTKTSKEKVIVGPSATGHTTAPPPTDHAKPYMWVSASQIPVGKATDLVAAVINPTSRALTYGTEGAFQHWTGRSWVADANLYPAMEGGGFGTVTTRDYNTFAVGLPARPHGVGDADYFVTPALTSGWYRVGYAASFGNPATFGIFQVTAHAPRPVPITNPTGAILTAQPTVIPPSGGTIQTVVSPAVPSADCHNPACRRKLRPFYGGLSPTIELQRWTGDRWQPILTFNERPPGSVPILKLAAAVTIPAEPAGAYRLVRQSRTTGALIRPFWIAETPMSK